MIHVTRTKEPEALRQAAGDLPKRVKAYFSVPRSQREQSSFGFEKRTPTAWLEQAKACLEVLFGHKCSYCESPLSPDNPGHVDWFRPRRGVAESSGGYLGDHYWAQAFEWANLYLICAACNRSKANRFPISGRRAPASADRKRLEAEQPLLVDPCKDNPEEHLVFVMDGTVLGSTIRGRATIEVLDLNRHELVKWRKHEAAELAAEIRLPNTTARIDKSQPFFALRKSVAAQVLHSNKANSEALQKAAREQEEFDVGRERASTSGKKALENLRARARFIERVEVKNIGAIERLTLDLAASKAITAPCMALLGTNGVGKSTLLKCIALALAGPQHVTGVGIKAKELLRDGAAEGEVTIFISGFKEPVRMTVTRKTGKFRFKQEKSRALILAYGSSRLLPSGSNRQRRLIRQPRGIAPAKIANLFNPFLPLTDATKWLKSVSSGSFDDVCRTLKALLPVEGDPIFSRGKRKNSAEPVTLRSRGEPSLTFSQLSDGYQSMLGLAADIMQMMYKAGFTSMRSAQGVVLIDELGNHLHPAWRMRVLNSFRNAFPQVQFIFSTHDPLCLLGLSDGEVAVLRKDRKLKVYSLENLSSIEGMRVDQLLTSEHFGLDSLVDPDTDIKMKRYQALRAKSRTSSEEAELAELTTFFTQSRLLGQTWRERLALQAADEVIGRLGSAKSGRVDSAAVSREVVDRLQSLLDRSRGVDGPARKGRGQ